MEEKNYTGEKFLDKLYKDLFNSEIVEHTKEKSDSRGYAIKKYMDRLEKAHQNATTENRKERLKRLYYDKYIIKEENLPKNLTDDQKIQIIENQKQSLNKWLDYLTDENARYPMWAKYWVFQGMLKMGTYDEAHEVYQNRSKKTLAPFVDANPEIIANAIDILEKQLEKKEINDEEIKKVIETGSFSKIYTILQNKYKKNLSSNETTDGIWIKYNEGSEEEAKKLSKSLEGKNTGWCTASENMAIEQVCGGNNYQGGDFYVYYTKDQENNYTNPRIAIRMDGKNEIGEIRGIEESQNMEECMIPIIEKKLHEMDFLNQEDIEKYLDKIEGLKELSILNKKRTQNIPFSLDEVINIYTKNYGFGWENDPRVEKIQSQMTEKDFECFKEITNKEKAIDVIKKFHPEVIYNYFNSDIRKDKDIALEAVKRYGWTLQYADESLTKNKEVVLAAIKENGSAMKFADPSLKEDKNFILSALNFDERAFEHIDENLKNDINFAIKIVEQNGNHLNLLPESLKQEKKVVLAAVKQNGLSLMHADKSLKQNKEIVLEAVKQNGEALRFADKDLTKDKKIVLVAVKKKNEKDVFFNDSHDVPLQYADDSLKQDKEVVLEAVRHDGRSLYFADKKYKKNKFVVLEAVRQYGNALANADESLTKDKEVVLAAVRQNGLAFQYADESLKNDREFILAAVRQNGSVLDLVDERYKQDKKIVMAAVKQNGYALQYADDSLKQDNEVVMAAMKQNSDALYDADESLRFNEEMQLLEEKYDKMQNNVIIKKLTIKIDNFKQNINYELYKIKFKLQAKFEPQGKKL